MRLRVNVLCVIGFVLGVIAILATDSGSWFLDTAYWGEISLAQLGNDGLPSDSFYDVYCYLYAAGSVLVVIGVMASSLSQVGGFAQLLGHGLLLLSLQSSRFADVAPFQDLLVDGLWLSFVSGFLVAISGLAAIWWEPPKTLRTKFGGSSMSQGLLAVSPSDPSGTLRLNLVALVGAIVGGLAMFLPWFAVTGWVLFMTVDSVTSYQSLIASMGDGYVMVESSADIYFVVAVVTLSSVAVASWSTLGGIVHIFASSVFLSATYAAEITGFFMQGLHVAESVDVAAGPFVLIACGVVVLLSSWWRLELVLRPTGARIERSGRFSVATVRTQSAEEPSAAAPTCQNDVSSQRL